MAFSEKSWMDSSGGSDEDPPLDSGTSLVPGSPESPLPPDVTASQLSEYCRMLGDDAFVMSRRLQNWCGRTLPVDDGLALVGAAFDLLEQAFHLYTRAGFAGGDQLPADHYAFCRASADFRNVALAEAECARFGRFVAVLLLFTTWRCCLFRRLTHSRDPGLRWIAETWIRRLENQRTYTAEWAVLLGKRTDDSRERFQECIDETWGFVDELFAPHGPEPALAGIDVAASPSSFREDFEQALGHTLTAASIKVPEIGSSGSATATVGRLGIHTAEMDFLLGPARETGCGSCPGPRS